MTEKIYYQDVEATTATARVMASGKDEIGNYVVLDRSCFYPEGGGQPADTGTIGESAVTDVQIVDEEIRHYTVDRIKGGKYDIAIDWKRRFDHMQQHTGQHLLSAVFEDEFGMTTKSFHLGTERVSIDLDVPEISAAQLNKAEEQVNSIIYRQISIRTEWVTQERVSEMNLRKVPAVQGDIRLVTIADIDMNACGGTHLQNTAELDLVKIIRTEKAKSGTRVYFLCGNRAMQHFELLQSVTDQLTRILNAPTAELAESATAILVDRKEQEKQLKKITLQLLNLEATNLNSSGNTMVRDYSGRTFKEVHQLAKLAVEKLPSVYLLFFIAEETNMRFVCAKGKKTVGDMRQVLGKIIENTDGKIGGTENLALGCGPLNRNLEFVSEAFQNIIEEIA